MQRVRVRAKLLIRAHPLPLLLLPATMLPQYGSAGAFRVDDVAAQYTQTLENKGKRVELRNTLNSNSIGIQVQ